MPENSKIVRSYSVYGINTASTGPTLIFTTENSSQKFYVSSVSLECVSATGVTLVAAGSLGTNASTYNNILAIFSLTGLTAANTHLPMPLTIVSSVIPPNTGVYFNLTTAITGGSQTINVHVLGFYGP
jgi:hypothetical protein